MRWQDKAAELKFDEGVSWTKLPTELEKIYGTSFNHDQVRSALRDHPRYKCKEPESQEPIDVHESIKKSLVKECTIKDLAKSTGQSERLIMAVIEDIKDEGTQITELDGKYKICRDIIPQDNYYKSDWKGDKIIRFGLMGDQQSGSKYTQHTHLHNFYDICKQEGLDTVYHTGDMFEGEKMRPGHEYEIHVHGVDDNIEFAAKTYPKREGIKTKFISGNHCHSFIKQAGCDVGTLLAAKRDDMIYLGKSSAIIQLTPNCKLELSHPIDGTAYALSYKTQKMIDAMQGGEKPNILAIGHYHKAEYLPNYRNLHAFQTGTFQMQTAWMKGKQLAAMVGGWIIEVYVDEEGTVTRCKGEFVPYYKMDKEDWRNWS